MNANLPATPTSGVSTAGSSMAINPMALIQRVRDIQTVRDSVMEEGIHYYSLQNRKVKLPNGQEKEVPQYSLGKAGAETLLLAFGLRSEVKSEVISDDPNAAITVTREQWVDGPSGRRVKVPQDVRLCWSYEIKSTCTIFNPGGEPIASASGSANAWETAFRGFSTPDSKNPVLKRAEKRALVAAVLMATGCSSMFGQDLEDMAGDAGNSAPPPPVAPAGPTNGLNEKQNNLAYVKAKDIVPKEELDDFMVWFKGLTSNAKKALDDLCAGGDQAKKVLSAYHKARQPQATPAAQAQPASPAGDPAPAAGGQEGGQQ